MIEAPTQRSVPALAWATVAATLVGLPLLNAHVLEPWVFRGVERGDRAVWWAYLAELLVLHVALSAAICRSLKAERASAASIGLDRPDREHVFAAAAVIAAGIAVVVLRHIDIFDAAATNVIASRGTLERSAFVAGSIGLSALQEPIFRGFAITYLARLGRATWPAVLGSSIAFGYYHGGIADPGRMIGTFAGGLFLSWLYLRTGSLWWPMILHAGFTVAFVAIT